MCLRSMAVRSCSVDAHREGCLLCLHFERVQQQHLQQGRQAVGLSCSTRILRSEAISKTSMTKEEPPGVPRSEHFLRRRVDIWPKSHLWLAVVFRSRRWRGLSSARKVGGIGMDTVGIWELSVHRIGWMSGRLLVLAFTGAGFEVVK